MSEMLEHRECADALGAYALGALPDLENDRVRRHVASCRQCRAELEGLRAAVDALPASVPQIDPPPQLKARLMEIVEAEAEVLRAAGEAADRPSSRPADGPQVPVAQTRRRWGWRRTSNPGLAFACACLIALAIVIAILGSGGPGGRTIQAQVSPHYFAAGTRATLELRGTRAQLVLTALPKPPAGHVDELWVKRGTASPQPAGTFVVGTGSVQVDRPVRSGDVVMLTYEPAPGTSAPTAFPLIVAHA